MTMNVSNQKLQDVWRECQRHVHHLRHALQSLEPELPLSGGRLAELDDEAVQDLDQFVLRFGKLQDAIGGRLLPAVLGYLQEPYEDRPMLDKLNRLEKLGYLPDVERWQELRAIRNRFAHDYPDDHEKNAALLNVAVESVTELVELLKRIEQKLDLPPLEEA
ncbi:hypothetical protein [Aidingimonas halophila]|uniref:Nucleotidyltransferase substrate binding protein, HI0074 family n=1 Tax=Aidingimonas halophila TaxID=574349 RepID=A0A1H3CKZ6_9GAMM|nr:hypothetical protein [Aidingimonas halophila]GHC35269.1 hypothetical protein GCM10008094_30510 [Aidingimonas halophila]SDX54922.1 hypothetical protein SAMN05443545_10645 [Aidingimonas halophila]